MTIATDHLAGLQRTNALLRKLVGPPPHKPWRSRLDRANAPIRDWLKGGELVEAVERGRFFADKSVPRDKFFVIQVGEFRGYIIAHPDHLQELRAQAARERYRRYVKAWWARHEARKPFTFTKAEIAAVPRNGPAAACEAQRVQQYRRPP